MDDGSQKNPPNDPESSAEPGSLQGFFQAPSPHPYTQPTSFLSQAEPGFYPLYSPGPSAGLHSPSPFVSNNSGQPFTFAALNYHHGTPGGQPTPPLQFPITPGSLASTPDTTASTPQPEEASKAKNNQVHTQEKPVASKKGKGARSGKNTL